jgi:hypothetical protein
LSVGANSVNKHISRALPRNRGFCLLGDSSLSGSCWRAAPLWSHLKRSLANLAKRNLAQLTARVKTRLKRMQYRPALLDGFLASTGLDLTPFCNPHH